MAFNQIVSFRVIEYEDVFFPYNTGKFLDLPELFTGKQLLVNYEPDGIIPKTWSTLGKIFKLRLVDGKLSYSGEKLLYLRSPNHIIWDDAETEAYQIRIRLNRWMRNGAINISESTDEPSSQSLEILTGIQEIRETLQSIPGQIKDNSDIVVI